jgi:hypothetical protein
VQENLCCEAAYAADHTIFMANRYGLSNYILMSLFTIVLYALMGQTASVSCSSLALLWKNGNKLQLWPFSLFSITEIL